MPSKLWPDQRREIEILEQKYTELLNSTLANFGGSPGARDAVHRIILNNLTSILKHEFHSTKVAKSAPATFCV